MNVDMFVHEVENQLNTKVEKSVIDKNGISREVLVVGEGNKRPMLSVKDIENADADSMNYFIDMLRKSLESADAMLIGWEMISNYEEMKSHLRLCAGQKAMSNGLVREEVLDLCKYVRIVFDDYSTVVTEPLLEAWGITKDELFNQAKNNTEYKIAAMGDVFNLPSSFFGNNSMMIASTNDMYYGAGCIFDTDILDEVASRFDSDIYIIPSSVHEILAVPLNDDKIIDIDEMRKVINEVNMTCVDDYEILSDSLYKYSKDDKQLMIA